MAAAGRAAAAPRFAAGLLVVALATESGLAAYDDVLFSLHVVQHLLLGIVAPLLLVLGAPVTLALQAGSRRTQRRLLGLLHSLPVRVLTHPVTAWTAFGGTLFLLYGTPLYELSLRHEWFHVAVHVHFVVVGSLFFAHVVGLDPIPHSLGYGARLLYVGVALPFHAFLGVVLLSSRTVLAGSWYDSLGRTWGASPLTDQRTGAGLLWVAGELLGVVAIVAVVARWMAHEERVAARHDRRLAARSGRLTAALPGRARSVVERECEGPDGGAGASVGRFPASAGVPVGSSAPVGSGAGHLGPGELLVDAGLAGEAEHALAEDVAHDLRGAALDRVGPGAQEHLARRAGRALEADGLGAAHLVVVADEAVGTEQVDAELVDGLVHLGEAELGDRALGARVAGLAVWPRPAGS